MADTGANVCITGDRSILTNVVDIDPIPLGVVVHMQDSTHALCTQQGFLPIPLCDGSYHYQPFLVNPHTTDTILSPAHVMGTCDKISGWHQTGSKSQDSGNTLTFVDCNGQVLLMLPLSTHNGLQYCSKDALTGAPPAAMASTISCIPPDVPQSSPHGPR